MLVISVTWAYTSVRLCHTYHKHCTCCIYKCDASVCICALTWVELSLRVDKEMPHNFHPLSDNQSMNGSHINTLSLALHKWEVLLSHSHGCCNIHIQIPTDQLHRSHITQYQCSYCNQEDLCGYHEVTMTLLGQKVFSGIREFHVTCWVDKTWQEAGSWALSLVLLASNTPRYALFSVFSFDCQYFRSVRFQKHHSTLWECWKPPELWVLALESQEQQFCHIHMLRTLCYMQEQSKIWTSDMRPGSSHDWLTARID